jgi:hypothetical protein
LACFVQLTIHGWKIMADPDASPIDSQESPPDELRFSSKWSFRPVVDSVFAAGEAIAPARITSAAGRQFAAMQLILTDLSFALECLTAADKIGVPDQSDLNSKSLIFAAVVAYARPFKTGVREIKLDCEMFVGAAGFDAECHKFLIALRDRHVAHSVNEFERCEAVAIVVGTPETGWRDGGCIGTIGMQVIGLTRSRVRLAISHITAMIGLLSDKIDKRRIELYQEFSAKFAADGKWEMAPMHRPIDLENVTKPRPKSA